MADGRETEGPGHHETCSLTTHYSEHRELQVQTVTAQCKGRTHSHVFPGNGASSCLCHAQDLPEVFQCRGFPLTLSTDCPPWSPSLTNSFSQQLCTFAWAGQPPSLSLSFLFCRLRLQTVHTSYYCCELFLPWFLKINYFNFKEFLMATRYLYIFMGHSDFSVCEDYT